MVEIIIVSSAVPALLLPSFLSTRLHIETAHTWQHNQEGSLSFPEVWTNQIKSW